MKNAQAAVLALALLGLTSCKTTAEVGDPGRRSELGGEHPGTTAEHAGKSVEHAGVAAEHAGAAAEHAGQRARGVTAEQIKEAMGAYITARVRDGGGAFRITDERSREALSLEFVKIHDPVRKIEKRGYFACTDFHPVGAEGEKLYDLDFWLQLREGTLVVTEERIHKHPEQQGSAWVKRARYTFENDDPIEIQ
ncbi:MAG: hypothetical protein HYZ28_24605 [Myxococcales bacterium]|nr:hypothetical protein [Myxococcales bacterium]